MLRVSKQFLLWVPFVIAYSVTFHQVFLWIPFALLCARLLMNATHKITADHLLELILYSIIIPNNYVIIAVVVLAMLFAVFNPVKRHVFPAPLVVVTVVYLIGNMLVCKTPWMNSLFVCIYLCAIPAVCCLLSHLEFTPTLQIHIKQTVKDIILLQLVWLIFYTASHLSAIKSSPDMDWVAGTFGVKQGNIFFLFCAFSSFIFLQSFLKTFCKKDMAYYIICVGLIMCTGSIGLCAIYLFTILVFVLMQPTVRLKYKAVGLVTIGIAVVIVMQVNPTWVVNDILKMNNINSASHRVAKTVIYQRVFCTLPSEDPTFAVFGTGIGQGCSRASITCTGWYIDSYSKNFPIYISSFIQNNIFSDLKVFLAGQGGMAQAPFSSILSVQSELGWIGTVLLAVHFGYLLKSSSKFSKIVILFFAFTLFWDNYLEYAKVIASFAIVLFWCNSSTYNTPKNVLQKNTDNQGEE
ncbi:MAG: hypothetical protein LKE53_11320 [Oscillospiraceae bacterium]|jgi:hypothetical protein|nr:hypothetical protein [Oscillospiraceae bacterium]